MTMTIEAIYENGVLKPATALPLQEHEKVQITLHTAATPLSQASGVVTWKGDPATFDRFALDPELDPQEGP